MNTRPVTVTVTGAAGQITYALLFRIASGQLLGRDTPVRLQLLEIPQAVRAAEGTAMELDDCAFPLLQSVEITDNADRAFDGASIALLVGARPRGKGMERADLLDANGGIFGPQGAALNAHAADDIRVLVVGRLDHNRAVSQIARQLAVPVDAVRKVTIWGNHSSTQYPDLSHAEVNGSKVSALVDESWTREVFIPTVSGRGAAILDARGASSAASAANAAIGHVQNWIHGTPADTCTSAAVVSDGSYGVPEGLVSGFPVVSRNGRYQIAQGLRIDQRSRDGIDHSVTELLKERDLVVKHGPVSTAI